MERRGSSLNDLEGNFLVGVGLVTEWYSLTCDHATREVMEWAARRFSLS